MTSPLAVGGNRARWEDLPESVHAVIERAVGARVIGATSQAGGFSPAMASVLTLADGRSVFAKAVTEERSEYAAAAIRREADILAGLPTRVPAPALIWAGDHIDEAGDWAIMITEAVDGRTPAQPWRPDELRRFLNATTVLADSLTPAPFPAPAIAEDTDLAGHWATIDHPRSAELAELEFGWVPATEGDALLHGDLRADNFLLTPTGFVVVDWPAACTGARWLDLMISLPSVAMHGGGDPDALWSAHPLSREADPGAVDSVLAGLAGYFLANAALPPVPLLPTLREFQRAQGDVALRWLGRRRGWS